MSRIRIEGGGRLSRIRGEPLAGVDPTARRRSILSAKRERYPPTTQAASSRIPESVWSPRVLRLPDAQDGAQRFRVLVQGQFVDYRESYLVTPPARRTAEQVSR